MIAYRNPQYTNGRAAGSAQSVVELCDPVYYVSPLVTLTRTGYSKHYFEGERRICTVIGGCAVKPCLITAVSRCVGFAIRHNSVESDLQSAMFTLRNE